MQFEAFLKEEADKPLDLNDVDTPRGESAKAELRRLRAALREQKMADVEADAAADAAVAESKADATPKRIVLQLGTTNWQRNGEFSPGSGILHEAHHIAYNGLENTIGYSIYPSKTQSDMPEENTWIFPLTTDIPVFTTIPTSSFRYTDMSEDEFAAYRKRLTDFVKEKIAALEEKEGQKLSVAIAHHTFINILVLTDINAERAEGDKFDVAGFVHGTALKMYQKELAADAPRFQPLMKGAVDQCTALFAISEQQINLFKEIFPEADASRVFLSPNGINQQVFQVRAELTREGVLSGFSSVEFEGEETKPVAPLPVEGFTKVVLFVGKFADWKRLDALLAASKEYEAAVEGGVMTLVVGTGPPDQRAKFQTMAKEVGGEKVFFLGPQPHAALASLYNVCDLGVFPSYQEPMGLVFIECMACGTPVVGANSGGPRDFGTCFLPIFNAFSASSSAVCSV